MKKFNLLVVLVFVLGFTSMVTFAQRPDPSGKGRYTIVTNEIFTQPQYTGPSSLDGLGKKTAGELGLTGKRVYNEYPKGPVLVTLSASAVIYYDTASLEPLYLDGCIVNGKSRPNRLKLEDVVVVEKVRTVEVPGPTITKTVEVPGPTVTNTVAGPCVPGEAQTTNERYEGRKARVTRDGCNTVAVIKTGPSKLERIGVPVATGLGGFLLGRLTKHCPPQLQP